jgi:hypothetical protein
MVTVFMGSATITRVPREIKRKIVRPIATQVGARNGPVSRNMVVVLAALLVTSGAPDQGQTQGQAPAAEGAVTSPGLAPAAQGLPTSRTEKIDRRALVSRHNVSFDRIDPTSPLMVGNGNFAFTADITGLQTFPEQYSPLVPLLTQAQWGWHSFPGPAHYKYEDSLVPVKVHGRTQYYPWLHDWSEANAPVIKWLRENPHRISLGRASLYLMSRQGRRASFADLSATQQTLDLWSGTLLSQFDFDGEPVQVRTQVHPSLDMLIVTLTSPALAAGRLGVDLMFPGVSPALNPNPADWEHPELHQTTVMARGARRISFQRRLDDTRYYVTVSTDRDVNFTLLAPHAFRILPSGAEKPDSITVMVLFSEQPHPGALPDAAEARAAVTNYWGQYWSTGGVVDLSGSTDPRAFELERRIVLSQYLMAVNAAGTLPPQEEGLFSNSWNGKFHLEMHIWHAGHFALWGHPELLERSMGWYLEHLEQAKVRARAHGLQGAWWPKMVGPEGRESPSTIGPFIMWQQPSPIYLSELIYRAKPAGATLDRYRNLVFETADLLASFAYFDRTHAGYVLGPPIIPAQEVFPPLETYNPTFELEYFRFGLATAQKWRERLGLARSARWDAVIEKLAPLPRHEGLYLATESFPQLWDQARSPMCSGGHMVPQCWNRDHPSLLAALGFLPGEGVDGETMRRTLQAVKTAWDLRQTWGWDFPMMAMTAARLHEPEQAIDLLLYNAPNNQFGRAGMTPRVHLETGAPSYRLDAQTYFPSNGSLLFAVALMAAGWDGEATPAPGFPRDGRWRLRWEGLQRLP